MPLTYRQKDDDETKRGPPLTIQMLHASYLEQSGRKHVVMYDDEETIVSEEEAPIFYLIKHAFCSSLGGSFIYGSTASGDDSLEKWW